MIDYRLFISKEKGTYFRAYIAKIHGSHSQYYYDREFQPATYCSNPFGKEYYCELDNGVFEVCVSQYDAGTKERLNRQRWWIVINSDEIDFFEYDEMKRNDVLREVETFTRSAS